MDGAHGVIVAGNHVIDAIGRAVGVDHCHDRDTQTGSLLQRDLFVAHVDDKQHIGQRAHMLDAAEALLELGHLTAHLQRFFLGTLVQSTGAVQIRQLHQPLD